MTLIYTTFTDVDAWCSIWNIQRIECRDITVIFSIFPISYHDFAHFYRDFLTAIPVIQATVSKH